MPGWLEVAIRAFVGIFILFILTKILGKRQAAQLSYFEYIVGITMGGIVTYTVLNLNINWYLGIAALIVLSAVMLLMDYATLKSKTARDIIDGKGEVIIKEGKVLEDNLKKTRLTSDKLLEQLRTKNAFKLADVEYAVLESGGNLNVLLNKENQPLTSTDLGIKVGAELEPQTVIMDGMIMDEPLATAGLNRGWLRTELEKLGVTIENVFLGQVDSYGQLTVDLFNDQLIVPKPQLKAQLLATLKKCEADIEMFGLSSKDKKAIEMYCKCSSQLQDVITRVRPILASKKV